MKSSRNLNDLVCEVRSDGTIKDVNFVLQQFTGLDSSEILNTSFFSYFHNSDQQITVDAINSVNTENASVEFISRLKMKNGDSRLVKWNAKLEDSHSDIRVTGSVISKLKIPTVNGTKLNGRRKEHFKDSFGVVFIHDLTGRFLYVDKNISDILGYGYQEIIDMTLYDILDREYYGLIKKYLEELATKGRYEETVFVKHKRGDDLAFNIKCKLNEDQFDKPLISGIAKDISKKHFLWRQFEKKKNEQNSINGIARIGTWELDIDSQNYKWSKIARQIFEVDAAFEPSLDKELAFYTPESREQLVGRLRNALTHGESWDLELQLTSAAGKEIWIRSIGVAELGHLGRKRLYGTFQDITKNKAVEANLVLAKKAADLANEAKSEFLANMSHEIRTPLNGVIGFTDLLTQTSLNETQKQYLSVVMQSGNALLNTINDILDFSKIEAGKLEINESRFSLRQMAEESCDVVKYKVQSKGLEMLLNIACDLPEYVWVDEVRIKQVLINLLSNAAKFTHHGEIELKVQALSDTSLEKINYRFSVRDTGIGIQPEKKTVIFDAFAQEDASTTKKYGGTGLGLSISNNLLELMNSKLQVESLPGKGSTFFFDIVLQSETSDDFLDTDNFDKFKKVLIVDDNRNNRLIVKHMLSLKEIQSQEAGSGRDALELIRSGERYDLILMDYHMPEMDGLQTIRSIRTLPEFNIDTPVVLLHSSSDERIIRECEDLQIQYRLLKPIKVKRMFDLLYSITSDKQKKGELNSQNREIIDDHIKVLIAEDNAVNMLLAKTIIKRIAPNSTVYEAKNGLEAIDFYRSNDIDIILMDIQMPEMNGYEAAMMLRSMYPHTHTPIIALTAGNIKGEREKCLAAGMDDFITKPVVANTVALAIKRGLNVAKKSPLKDTALHSGTVSDRNLSVLKEYLGDDNALLGRVVSLLVADFTSFLEQLDELLISGDISNIHQLTHKIYDTSITLGLTNLSNLVTDIRRFHSMENVDKDILDEVRKELTSVLGFLGTYKV